MSSTATLHKGNDPHSVGGGEFLYVQSSDGQHSWQVYPSGEVKVLESAPVTPSPPRTPIPVFDEWSSLNQIIADFRSRFDVLREELPKCKTKAEVKMWLEIEGFATRYPILPESLPD